VWVLGRCPGKQEILIVVTHDGAFYNRLFRSSQRAVLLRVTESHARRRLKETLPALTSALRGKPNRVAGPAYWLCINGVLLPQLPSDEIVQSSLKKFGGPKYRMFEAWKG
jgi:hypothetical protein